MAMVATEEGARAFCDAIVNPDAALPAAIEWINDNLNPGDVFASEKLADWAKAAGFQRPE